MIPRSLLSAGLALSLLASVGRAAEDLPAFRNPDLPVQKRVDDLVSRLTVPEKISQLLMSSAAIPRLGIPAYDWWNEALHGVARNGIATVFPQAIGLAATWNPELHGQVATVISTEARAKYNALVATTGGATRRYQGLTIWSPNINIFRDPRWGRGQETYGEDPFLTSRLAVAFVRGLQGDDPAYLKTVATLKHFAVHSGPEELRHRFDAVVSERDLRETYLVAFEAGVREGGALSLMSAYNAVDGVPAPANTRLLGDILRREWGFAGAVVGDVDTVADIWSPTSHAYAKDAAEASALALKAGNDLCSGTTYEALGESLKRGSVSEADIDRALRRLLTLRFRLGLFDPASRVPYARISPAENDSEPHGRLALEASRQSLVLLKNDGVLPLNPRAIKSIALIGPVANDRSAMLGNYYGIPSHPQTLLDAFRARFEPLGVRVLTAFGAPVAQGFREDSQPFGEGIVFADAALTQPGFKGEVFANPDLSGPPVGTRVDRQLDLKWNPYQPLPNVPTGRASGRWTATLVPPASGHFTFGMVLTGKARLYLDDKPVIDQWSPGDHRSASAEVTLSAGKPVRVRLEYSQGAGRGEILLGWKTPADASRIDGALAVAREADVVVLALGLTPDIEGEEMQVNAPGFHGGDRTSIRLPAPQAELLDRISATGKPVVVVLVSGSAIAFDPSKADAALVAWYYGGRGGEAVVDTLVGEANPAGRLPVTFYASDEDLPPFESYSMANRTYRYFTGKPLYAFGHGLSYTTFAYEKVSLSAAAARSQDVISVAVTVRDSGAREGDEVVQVYAHALNPPVAMPLQSLVGFQRVHFVRGEQRTVSIPVPVWRLRRWDEASGSYRVDPGVYEIRVGAASDDIRLTTSLRIE